MSKSLVSSPESYLRSINVQMDAASPERIAHFQPTSKAARLIRALYEGDGAKAWLVSAPYGTGKSLAATYALQIVENQSGSKAALRGITERLTGIDEDLGESISSRLRSKRKGVVLALHGHVESLPEALKEAAVVSLKRLGLGSRAGGVKRRECNTIDDAVRLLESLVSDAKSIGIDRVMLVWDEFGRHLEALVSEGRSSELLEVQQLAEYAARTGEPAFRMALILHQGIASYSGGLPEAARREWSKIEGRFEKLEYVDDSREITQLIAHLVKAREFAEETPAVPAKSVLEERVASAQKLGLLSEFTKSAAVKLVKDAWPLSIASLCVLPRVAARMAQNERTLFSFLMSVTGDGEIGLDSLYRFFEPVMRGDTAPGGTYRQWLETQSAVAKVEREIDVSVLHSCTILSLGLSGERSKVSRPVLEFAVTPALEAKKKSYRSAVTGLIKKKLLLHRVHSDVISLWHGTDVDVRSRLNDAKDSFRAGFEVREFLAEECPPPVWRPVRHNDENWIRRYVQPEYQLAGEFMAEASFSALLEEIPLGVDLKLIYLLPQGSLELEAARELGRELTGRKDMRRLLVAIPTGIADLSDACLEVYALMQLQQDEELVGSDPLVLDELKQMEDDARGRLMLLADRVIQPNPGLEWHWNGETHIHTSSRALREWLSSVADTVYPNAPIFRNEVINRKKPSAPVVNARKKLTGAILELSGTANLGFGDERFRQEVSAAVEGMYRAVLVHTGLYGEGEGGRWGYTAPSAVKGKGLKKVWQELQGFFTTPAAHPKSFADLMNTLLLPPIGLRAGVIPVLLAAASRAFPTAGAITRDGEYVDDLKPSDLEELCKEPERFKLSVVELDANQEQYLEGFYEAFGASSTYEIDRTDLIGACMEALEIWKEKLPTASKSSSRISKQATKVRERLFNQRDPLRLLLKELPEVLVGKEVDYEVVLSQLLKSKQELEVVTQEYYGAVEKILLQATSASISAKGSGKSQAAVKEWALCFPASLIDQVSNPKAKPLVARLLDKYPKEEKYLNAVATVVHGRKIEDWLDSDLAGFEQAMRNIISDIEEAALHPTEGLELSEEASTAIAGLVERRIGNLMLTLERLVGPKASKNAMDALVGKERVKNG